MDKEQQIRKEVMFLYAMTTITRKSVILDSASVEPVFLIELSTVPGALSVGY